MSSLAGQSSARMAGGHCYTAAQTSALMVAPSNQVRCASAKQGQLKMLHGALAGIKEEVHVSEVDRQSGEALGFEKGKQLGGFSTSFGEPEVPNPSRVARRAEEVDVALSSLAETNFAGLFCLGKLDHDNFHQFCGMSKLKDSSSDSEG
ncbi:unnamed protein product [Lactuca saligna]|uniref:Uncharacterized protein n=1 Tax=Lactuca saligna TaxID=75948 RepID=A0AA35Z1G0_LACSI|nr:unnamed protein product [Lactuca saligna]